MQNKNIKVAGDMSAISQSLTSALKSFQAGRQQIISVKQAAFQIKGNSRHSIIGRMQGAYNSAGQAIEMLSEIIKEMSEQSQQSPQPSPPQQNQPNVPANTEKLDASAGVYRAGTKFANGVDFNSLKKSLAQGGFDDFDTQPQIEETPEAQRAENFPGQMEDAQHMPEEAKPGETVEITRGQFTGQKVQVESVQPGGLIVAAIGGKKYSFKLESYKKVQQESATQQFQEAPANQHPL